MGCSLLPAVNPNTCSSTRSERLARFFNKKEITLPAGSPCNEFKGYCDVFMKCRLVDADGPLARLKKAIFNPELYENIAEWIVVRVWSASTRAARACSCHAGGGFQDPFSLFSPLQAHWWAVLLMGIALIMLMAGFIKICSVHTPSSNPKLPPPKPLPGEICQETSGLSVFILDEIMAVLLSCGPVSVRDPLIHTDIHERKRFLKKKQQEFLLLLGSR